MGHPISDFMGNWLNTTYQYLKETGGPTYPPTTVGPDLLPGGAYTHVEDLPENYYDQPITSGFPLPFNPEDTGLAPIVGNQIDAANEEAKQNSIPTVSSNIFDILYSGMMNACIADQKHAKCNPNAGRACRDLAESGDVREIILTSREKAAIGMKTVVGQEKDKPDEVRKAENADTLTSQIREGAGTIWGGMATFMGGDGIRKYIPEGIPSVGKPEGVNFQNLGEKIAGFIPQPPTMPQINTGTLVMVGGGILVLVLVVLVLK